MFPIMALESIDYFSAFPSIYKFSLPASEKEQSKGMGGWDVQGVQMTLCNFTDLFCLGFSLLLHVDLGLEKKKKKSE